MTFAFETPWALSGLVLILLPLLDNGVGKTPYPWLRLIPEDPLSRLFSLCLHLLGMAAVAALILGLAGLYRTGQKIERIGHGAHIVLLLDRSNSMDNTFAGRTPSGDEESKADAARRLLTGFVDSRKQDLIGLAEYSTAPLFIMPLTDNKQALQAAIAATKTPALAYTHISKGLAIALSYFKQQPLTGARIVLLVSDGAAAIDPDNEQKLREWFKQYPVSLYWIYLRTEGSPGIDTFPEDSRNDNAQAMPERYLHLFFKSLNIPYQAYQAESPDAVQQAIADIDRLENRPLHYWQRLPKQDLSNVCYLWAVILMLLLLGLKFCEVRR
ncbi:MAG: hypothetical protein CVV13_11200 [Gammaproteobacteria bacterium HGW-Gammaproteobacteria-3]|jgi:mxaC protein|nr:MAG: hypothetical protein CVV13_11200 [Gammaproteobacteria bacterium HGW-Gammaproteobacteria-3]